jgi:hypothetical protein
MNMRTRHKFATISAVLLTLLMTASLRAGTITLVNLPTNSTDIATGITANKQYVSAFDFGSLNTNTYSVNGVLLTHFRSAAQNLFPVTNTIDPNYGGGIIIRSAGSTAGIFDIDVTSSGSQGGTSGNVSAQADGNMRSVLTDLMYTGGAAPVGSWLQEECDNLIVGHQYSMRVFYRQWSSNRQQLVYFRGEGTNQPYSGNPVNEDIGGAHYIEYDFTAATTNVVCTMTNQIANNGAMIYASTLEDDSYPISPFLTYQAKVAGVSAGTYVFSATAIGTGPLAYQWYFNTTSNYTGASLLTNGNGYAGSTTTNLTTTTNLLDYYFVIVSNNYGSVTSSIVQINPLPVIVTQPSPVAVGNSVVFNVSFGGFLPLTCQWYVSATNNFTGVTELMDGSGYSGSATASLTTTTNLQDYYFAIVANGYGSVTSSVVAYNPRPAIVTQPAPARSGGSVTLTATASGWPTLAYQWYENIASNYAGATPMTDGGGVSGSATPSVTLVNLLAYYYVVASNYYGAVTSSIVQVASPLTIVSSGEPIWNQTSQTNVIITFSDMLDPVTAATPGNYSLNNGASIVSATLVASNEVVLATSPLTGSYNLTVQNVNDYFRITQTPVSTNLVVGIYPANLALWVRADTGVTTDSGTNTVNQWNDLSGNGNNLFGESFLGFAEPLLETNAWGDVVLTFTGTNLTEGTALLANDAPSLRITGDLSIVAVANFTVPGFNGSQGEIISKTGGSGANANIPAPYDYYAGSGGASLYRGNGTAYGQFTAATGPSVGTPHIMVVSELGNTVSDYIDGQFVGAGVLASGSGTFNESSCADQGQSVLVGGRADFLNNHFTGDLAELIVAGSAITSYDVAELGNYLITEHNLMSPNSTPADIVAAVGANHQLTLSWPLNQTGWQLQSNSIGLTATSSWFTVPGSITTNSMTFTADPTQTNVFYRLVFQQP